MEETPGDRGFFWRWVLATFGGWIFGVILVVLLAGLGEQVHLGNQWAVGAGMGWGVGCAQWLAARKRFGTTARWMWASLAGLGTPFVISDVLRLWRSEVMPPLMLANVLIGALLVGLWQRRMLRAHLLRPGWWVPACICGWLIAAALPLLLIVTRHGAGMSTFWRNVGGILSGGVALGIVTGGTLVQLSRGSAETERAWEGGTP